MTDFEATDVERFNDCPGDVRAEPLEYKRQQEEKAQGGSTVLIAHREQMVLDAVSNELASEAKQVRTTSNANELLAQVGRGQELDAVILDYWLLPNSRLEQIRKLVARLGETPLIVFAGMLEPRIITLLLKAGVRGIIPETLPLKAISSVLYLVGIGQVFTGGHQHDPALGEETVSNALNDEEYGVLRRAAKGDTNKEIAAQLDVTEVRVKMLMRGICRKISARNRAHACVLAREQGLL